MSASPAPRPRPLSPQAELDLKNRMVDRLVAEGWRPTARPAQAPKPTGGAS